MKFIKLYNSDYFKYKCVSANAEIYIHKYASDSEIYNVSIKQGLIMHHMGSFELAIHEATIDNINKEATECVKSYIKTITEIKSKLDKAVKEKTEYYATQIGVH